MNVANLAEEYCVQHFGKSLKSCIEKRVCVICDKDARKFKDHLSEVEFTMSGTCQSCQDKMFQYFQTNIKKQSK